MLCRMTDIYIFHLKKIVADYLGILRKNLVAVEQRKRGYFLKSIWSLFNKKLQVLL